jgi:transposase
VTETREPDQVHLITNVETTPAVAVDVDQTAPIHARLAARDLLPGDHLLDAGYVDAELLVGSQFEHGVRLVGPVRPNVSWQAKANPGFDIAHFTIDWEGKRVTCPEGKTSVLWKPGHDRWGNEVIHTEFARRECRACRARPLCTRATTEGREMTLRPRERHEALQSARVEHETAEWKAEYAARAGIEGTMSGGPWLRPASLLVHGAGQGASAARGDRGGNQRLPALGLARGRPACDDADIAVRAAGGLIGIRQQYQHWARNPV